ncbi:MAG: hypothetical protein V7679_11765, partial [Parasphingorhabdus sp.]
RLIPNLGRFEFLATGKAIKAERPIIVRRGFDPKKLEASLAVRGKPRAKTEPAAEEVVAEGTVPPQIRST